MGATYMGQYEFDPDYEREIFRNATEFQMNDREGHMRDSKGSELI
jgi:hypothetical protein